MWAIYRNWNARHQEKIRSPLPKPLKKDPLQLEKDVADNTLDSILRWRELQEMMEQDELYYEDQTLVQISTFKYYETKAGKRRSLNQFDNNNSNSSSSDEEEVEEEQQVSIDDIHRERQRLKEEEIMLLEKKWSDAAILGKPKDKWWELSTKEFTPNLRLNRLNAYHEEELLEVWLKYKSFGFNFIKSQD